MSMHQGLNNSMKSLSNSSSKQKFSFPRADRFLPTVKQSCQQPYYILPETKSRRTTSFGVGDKTSIALNKKDIPSPNRYKIQGEFQQSYLLKKRGFSFGLGRQEVFGGPLQGQRRLKNVPGPGQYNYHSTLQAPSPTLKSRLPDYTQAHMRYIPGPGHYNPPASLNEKGNYILSKYVNSAVRSFSPNIHDPPRKQTPGPGTYEYKSTIDPKGQYFMSKFENSRVRTFQKTPRPDISNQSIKNNPGPGAYNNYSQFG